MIHQRSVLWFTVLVSLLLVGTRILAGGKAGTHKHDNTLHGPTSGEYGHMMHGNHHQHDRWETPPAAYANKQSTSWGDPEAIARGQQLFQINCMVCHGTDGRGTGPAAKGLGILPLI